ncbi:MAG: GNAT family N-acetyltransferase [Flavobacteriales bacterium]|nr:GNAT family N-acetyltransferase [Flavobacteriales bacterium]
MEYKISRYKKKYASQFYLLNKDWISESWDLEESDLNDLLSPETAIIKLGGEIFFVMKNNFVVGTAAMIPHEKNKLELAKMTIKKTYRGNGLSKLLLEACIEFAKNKNCDEVFLISNSSLKIARHLYDKYGFKQVPLNNQKYKRGNVKMTLCLKN